MKSWKLKSFFYIKKRNKLNSKLASEVNFPNFLIESFPDAPHMSKRRQLGK